MAFQGYIDHVDRTTVSGWVFDDAAVDQPVAVEVLSGGRVVTAGVADQYRADLEAGGMGAGRHGFRFEFPGPLSAPLTVRVAGKRWSLCEGGVTVVPDRFAAHLSHPLQFGFPGGGTGFTEPAASDDEPAIVARLTEAYHRAVADEAYARGRRRDDVWSMLTDHCHGEIDDLLRRGDGPGTAAYLRDAHARDLTHGITQGHVVTPTLRARADARQLEHARFTDQLVSLAEYLGVLDVECPEQHGPWAENLYADPDALVARIGDAIGIPVVPPAVVGSMLGLRTAAGILSGRDLLALYAALRIRHVATGEATEPGGDDADAPAKPHVVEIGGGLGGVAYYVARLGFAARHTIVDLPLVNVLQGYYLMRALGGPAVRLYGERGADPAAVEVRPTFTFAGDSGPVDVLFNMDSIPEMHADYGLDYLRRARSRRAARFLSINQEARAPQHGATRQTVVRDLVAQVGGFRCQYRFRHWLRPGYVEELFSVAAAPPPGDGRGDPARTAGTVPTRASVGGHPTPSLAHPSRARPDAP